MASMKATVKEFIAEFARVEGRPTDLQWAASTIIEYFAASAQGAKYRGEAASADEPVTDASAPKAAVPKASTPKAAVPKASAPKALVLPPKAKVQSITIDGTSINIASWRAMLVAFVEHLVSAGKSDELPSSWFRDEDDRTVTKISDGKFLYTNLTGEQMLARMQRVTPALNMRSVVVTVLDGDGTAVEVAV